MEKYIEIGGRLHSTATGNVTTGANEILDDELNKKQSQINSETLQHVESIDAALQELSPDQTQALALATDVNTLKAKSVRGDETQSLTDAEKEQAISNMGVTGVYDISSEHPVSDHPKKYSTLPAALADVPVGRRKSGMSVKALMQLTQEMYHVEVTEGVTDLPTGYNEYELSEASSMTTGDYTYNELDTENFSAIPSTVGASVLYYIYDSQSSSYTTWLLTKSSDSIYAYKQYLYMQEYANTTAGNTAFLTAANWQGVDDKPTAGSGNLVKSGGVQNELALGAVYDVSAHNNGAKFESLSALLSDANLNALIPTSVRRGGMSIKFVQSSDNKYVQYRLMSNTWSTTINDWQGVDEEPTAGSENLVKSGGVESKINPLERDISVTKEALDFDINTVVRGMPGTEISTIYKILGGVKAGVKYVIRLKSSFFKQALTISTTNSLGSDVLTEVVEENCLVIPQTDVEGGGIVEWTAQKDANYMISYFGGIYFEDIYAIKAVACNIEGLSQDVAILQQEQDFDINTVVFSEPHTAISSVYKILGGVKAGVKYSLRFKSASFGQTLTISTTNSLGSDVLTEIVEENCISVPQSDVEGGKIIEWTAQKDANYMISYIGGINFDDITAFKTAYVTYNIEKLSGDISNLQKANHLWKKKLALDGDSICYGNGYLGGYGLIIANNNAMGLPHNRAVGGATLATGTKWEGTENNRHWISTDIANIPLTYDYIIIEGGVNDCFINVPIGTLTDGFPLKGINDTLDNETLIGALEYACRDLVTIYNGKKVGFVFTHYVFGSDATCKQYWDAAKPLMIQALNKWGVPFIDLGNEVPPLSCISSLETSYTLNGDGIHPNEDGYRKYYVDKIEAWMKTL